MQLVILDRDGVINETADDCIRSPTEWKPVRGSLEAIARLHRAGWRVVVAMTRPARSGKLIDLDLFIQVNERMQRRVVESGGVIDAIFFCPHAPEDHCSCRKPAPGLLLDIARRLHADLDQVPVIGDSLDDINAARAAGARPILVKTGHGFGTVSHPELDASVPVYEDLFQAADALLNIQNT